LLLVTVTVTVAEDEKNVRIAAE
jgi:hypothetical protein